MVEIKAPALRSLKEKLLNFSQVRSAAQLGIRLRVLVHRDVIDPILWLRHTFPQLAAAELTLAGRAWKMSLLPSQVRATMNSLFRIKAVLVKEFRQLSRDRITFGMVVMIPLIQLLLFGFAINTDVRNIPIGVVDQSDSSFSRLLVESVKVTQVIRVKQHYLTVNEAEKAIASGDIRAALILPSDLVARSQQQRELGQWLIDGSDTMIAGALLGLKNMPLTDLPTLGIQPLTPTFEITLLYNPAAVLR